MAFKIGQNKMVQYKYKPKTGYDLKDIITNKIINEWDGTSEFDLTDIDTSEVDKFNGLFFDPAYSKFFDKLKIINVSTWDTSKVTEIMSCFFHCNSLEKIIGIEDWDVSKVRDMRQCFMFCRSLKSIDLSKWNVRNVRNMNQMFAHCEKLKEIKGIGDWNVINVTTFWEMFRLCTSLENIDLESWKFNVLVKDKSKEDMFDACIKLKKLPSWY